MAAPNFPSSPTVNQEYTAPNSTTYKWDGTVWKALTSPELWSVSGATITPTDATKVVASAPIRNAVQWGSRTAKGRLSNHPSGDVAYFSHNGALNAGATAWVQDDVALPTWIMSGDATTDIFNVRRVPAGGGASTDLFRIDSAGRCSMFGTDTQITFGSMTIKGALAASTNGDIYLLSNNSFAPYDASKASWFLYLSPLSDNIQFARRAAGAAAGATSGLLVLDAAGNFVISGTVGQKAAGTTWSNPSDVRIKRDVTEYETGLDALLRLRPVRFEHNGLAGTTDGQVGYGYMADDVQCVMPEMVTTIKKKLRDDDEEEVDLQILDTSNVTLALVNAIKELAARITVLEDK